MPTIYDVVKAEGLQEGLQQGRQEEKNKFAQYLLAENPTFSDQKIASIIGCDLETVKQLRKQIKN
jgi:predicted transposase YdaD